MIDDLEVGVKFNADTDQLEEDLEDADLKSTVEMDGQSTVTSGGGRMSESQRQQQESVVSGGFSTALKATGLLAILSGLKPITSTLGALLGIVSRSLVPIIEDIADFIRPLFDIASDAAAGKQKAVQTAEQGILGGIIGSGAIRAALGKGAPIPFGAGRTFDEPSDVGESVSNGPIVSAITDSLFGTGTPDQSDEADKTQFKNNVEDAQRDRLGAQ